jgi:peptide deformylase
MQLVTIKSPDKKILKRKVSAFDFAKHSSKEIRDTVSEMRKIMKQNDGVGLSANQVGLNWRMFIAEYNKKLYVIVNPKITKTSKEIEILEEGCLSVPDKFIEIPRPESIIMEACDQRGKKIKIKAFGVLARIFQHETDHLNGKLITDYL